MKYFIMLVVYIISFVVMYLALSLIPFVATMDYIEIISNKDWLAIYTTVFGWWIPLFPARECYLNNFEYFKAFRL